MYSAAPIRFGSLSMVTATLGSNDPNMGDRCIDENGREYRFVYNYGTTANVGHGVVAATAATGYSVIVSSVTAADLVVGVVRHAPITTGAYGWVVTKGVTPVQMMATSGSVAENGLIEIAANGFFAPISNTTGNFAPVIGKALAAIVSSASGNAFISCYG